MKKLLAWLLLAAFALPPTAMASYQLPAAATTVVSLKSAGLRTVTIYSATPLTLPSVPTGTPATYACFTSAGALVKSSTAC